MESKKKEASLVIRIKRGRKDPLLIAKGYLTKAFVHKILTAQKMEVTSYAILRGLWNFLVGQGQTDLDEQVKKLEESAYDYPVSHEMLCKLYLQKAQAIIDQEKRAGNKEAQAVARALEDYDLEKLLTFDADKKGKAPDGMFM
jgi:hypothetical protein